jgi:hypothetical protein
MKPSSGCNLKGFLYTIDNALKLRDIVYPFKDEAQTALFKDPVRTAL